MADTDRPKPEEGASRRRDIFAPSPVTAVLGLFLLPLTWWAPLGIVAPLALMAFAALFLGSLLAPRVQAQAATNRASPRVTQWLLLAASALVVTAFVLDASASLRISIAAFVVSRSLLLFPAARISLSWLIGAHAAASLLSGIALGADTALCLSLITIAALLLDLTRSTYAALIEKNVASEGELQSASAEAASVTEAPQPDSTEAVEIEAGDKDAAVAEMPAPSAPAVTGDAEGAVEQPAALPARNEPISIVRATAALAAAFVAGLLLIVQTPSAPLATRSIAPEAEPAPSEAEIDTEWRERFPWAFPELLRPQLPTSDDGAFLSAECERSAYYEQIELHVLLEPEHEDGGGWTSVAGQFERPSLDAAPATAAEAVFGAPCSNDARLRVTDGDRIIIPDGLGFSLGETPIVVGAVHQLETARGPFLIARAYSDESGIILLIAEGVTADARIIAISNRAAFDRGGRLFAVEGGGTQLWYGALSEDAHSASAIDIIDISADALQNTGRISAWGASTCGQTLGDPLYPAEENCVEQPAWAYWLVEARYSTQARDRVEVIWNVRRQFGEEGEPATYEEPFDELMHGAYERYEGGWRLTRLTGPELNGLQAQLATAIPDAVVQQ